jgi:phenylacetate-CoA ligase
MNSAITKMLLRIAKPQVIQKLQFLMETQYYSPDTLRVMQAKKLVRILTYAKRNVPFYEDVNLRGMNHANVISYLRKMPFMTKDILRESFSELKSSSFTGRYRRNTSGGTTGEPVTFLQDNDYRTFGMASELLFHSWAGRKFYEPIIKLWGSERDTITGKKGILTHLKKLQNIYILNSFRMNRELMWDYYHKIAKIQPSAMSGYVQSLMEFAQFLEENQQNNMTLKGIISTAGTLHEEVQNYLRDIFHCPILNLYGSRETNAIACSCTYNTGLHLNSLHHFVEVLTPEGKECAPGDTGEIYITTLNNKVMPLIRYKIGDLAIPMEQKPCPCGRGLPQVKRIVGRTVDIFKAIDGTLVDGEFFSHLFYDKPWVRKFQVRQISRSCINVSIVGKRPAKQNLQELHKYIKQVMGDACEVNFNFVKHIPSEDNGKFRYTISDVD